MNQKLRQAFLQGLGIITPREEHYEFIKILSDEELLKPIVESRLKNGFTLQQIATKFGVELHKIKYISRTYKGSSESN